MTILFIDGFDIYSNSEANIASTVEAGMWGQALGVRQELTAANVRTGRAAIALDGGNEFIRTKVFASTSVMVFGVGFKPTTGTQDSGVFATWEENTGAGSQQLVRVGYDSQRRLTVWHGSSSAVVCQSSANAITMNTYQYVEGYCKAGVSTGEVIMRINEIEVCRASGINTVRSTGGPLFNQFTLWHANFNVDVHYFDDFYVLNGEGAVNNDFLGQVEIQTHHADANGDQNDFAVAGTSVNYAAVDEVVSDGDATYVHSSTVGHKELYKASSLTTGVTDVFCVMPVVKVRKGTAGSNSMYLLTRVSGVQASSVLKTPDTTYQFFQEVFETQPGGGNWTVAAVSALQVGFVLASTP